MLHPARVLSMVQLLIRLRTSTTRLLDSHAPAHGKSERRLVQVLPLGFTQLLSSSAPPPKASSVALQTCRTPVWPDASRRTYIVPQMCKHILDLCEGILRILRPDMTCSPLLEVGEAKPVTHAPSNVAQCLAKHQVRALGTDSSGVAGQESAYKVHMLGPSTTPCHLSLPQPKSNDHVTWAKLGALLAGLGCPTFDLLRPDLLLTAVMLCVDCGLACGLGKVPWPRLMTGNTLRTGNPSVTV
eukprot:scaffold7382_cov406-Prasinococcus_capsulatus_cf.AAC.31